MHNLNLYLDGLLICLMFLTILHSVKLNKQINHFKQYKNDFKSIMLDLSQNFDKADFDLKEFRNFAKTSSVGLEQEANKAQMLIDELKIIIDSGDRIASRLEQVIENGKTKAPAKKNNPLKTDIDYYKNSTQAHTAMRDDISTGRPEGGAEKSFYGKIRSKAEQEIMRALKIKAR